MIFLKCKLHHVNSPVYKSSMAYRCLQEKARTSEKVLQVPLCLTLTSLPTSVDSIYCHLYELGWGSSCSKKNTNIIVALKQDGRFSLSLFHTAIQVKAVQVWYRNPIPSVLMLYYPHGTASTKGSWRWWLSSSLSFPPNNEGLKRQGKNPEEVIHPTTSHGS